MNDWKMGIAYFFDFKKVSLFSNWSIGQSLITHYLLLITQLTGKLIAKKEEIPMQMLNSVNNLKVAKHFNLSEFACPCCNLVMLHPKLFSKLVELRNILERPVYITSGYRCSKYNSQIGGIRNSYHCIGLAADIKVKDINLIELLEICENIDFAGIGFYEKKNFLHLDVRPTKRTRWRE